MERWQVIESEWVSEWQAQRLECRPTQFYLSEYLAGVCCVLHKNHHHHNAYSLERLQMQKRYITFMKIREPRTKYALCTHGSVHASMNFLNKSEPPLGNWRACIIIINMFLGIIPRKFGLSFWKLRRNNILKYFTIWVRNFRLQQKWSTLKRYNYKD